ncbi:protein kinase [Massilia sp. WF1]|uniref:serine/threonine protein kinase n=1 Tax=unclassified Massilia TaxID=2609279 RepID=UPI00064B49B4|nr:MULTISPECIES: serine/threonine protein kinase [unclassified Massilia]ALK99047.1 protein kinase [Massilia sp. WG5]KLU36074.1 protein kinase [Massilia sp. WF1]
MDSLAHAIRQLQTGALPRTEFFAQVDRVLENAPGSAGRLLEVLSEEHARKPLPAEVYTEIQHRIERLILARQRKDGDDTFVQTRPGANTMHDEPPPRDDDGDVDTEPARMKGVGDTLNNRFVLEECIGFGGMGIVYKALDLRKLEAADRKPYIAIKLLNVQFRGHPKSLIALQREARKAQALAHPNIVSVYDFDRDGPMVYLTMEYLKGKSLSQVLRAPGFAGMPYADALPIVTGMANALTYAHGRGFVHCDFKPGNVFLTDAGKVKVIDFGIARVFQKTEEDADVTVFDPGSLGALTPAYASPEMLEHLDPDPRDDIYALACIAYELLTGRHPFNNVSALQARGGGMKPQRPAGLARGPWQALRSGLALERNARTPSAERFLHDFSAGGQTLRFGAAAATAAGILVAAVLGVAGWHYLGGKSRTQAPAQASAPTPAPPQASIQAPAPAPAAPPAPTAAAIAAALDRVPCAALVGRVDGHALTVQGWLSTPPGATGLKDEMAALPGVSSVNLDVRQVDRAKCPVISVFGPYWSAYRQAGGGAAIRLAGNGHGPDARLTEGDSLMVDVTTAGAESFVTVDYYALDGSVTHLLPNARARDNRAPPHYTATIGSLGEWGIGKPFGVELVVLVTTPVALFDGPRAVSEPAAAYLADAAKRLAQIRARSGAGKVAVEFLEIHTSPRKP